jgi:hypothetical protein
MSYHFFTRTSKPSDITHFLQLANLRMRTLDVFPKDEPLHHHMITGDKNHPQTLQTIRDIFNKIIQREDNTTVHHLFMENSTTIDFMSEFTFFLIYDLVSANCVIHVLDWGKPITVETIADQTTHDELIENLNGVQEQTIIMMALQSLRRAPDISIEMERAQILAKCLERRQLPDVSHRD